MMIAVEASRPVSPVKIRPYWMVPPISAITKMRVIIPQGGRTNHTSTSAVSEKRSAIIRIGGNWSSAALERVKPSPQTTGTTRASRMSRGFTAHFAPDRGWRGVTGRELTRTSRRKRGPRGH